MKNSDMSLVMVASRESEVLKLCLDSYFRNSKLEHELIIVVDEPSWNVLKVLQEYKLDYTLVQTHHYFRNCNIGAEKATRKYVGFLNDDVVFGPFWDIPLQKFIEFMETNGQQAMVSSNLLDHNKGNTFGYKNGDVKEFNRKQFEDYATSALTRKDIGGWFWFPLLIPLHLFKKYGGFTTFSNQACGHEINLENIIKNKEGLRVITIMASTIYHFGSGHISDEIPSNLWPCVGYFKCSCCGTEKIETDVTKDLEHSGVAEKIKRGEKWVCEQCGGMK